MKHDDTTLQAAIDAAMLEIGRQITGNNFAASLDYEASWTAEQSDRLDLAKAFLAKLPEPEPILADDGRSLGQVAFEAGNAVQKLKFPERELETWEENAELHDMLEAAAQSVANVVLAQAIRRMAAVSHSEITNAYWQEGDGYENIRSRLIAAARGEAEQQADSTDWKARAEKAEAEVADMRESLESKDRVHKQDIDHLESRLYKAESELAALKSSQTGILRPLAEAGPVPDGCVRMLGNNKTDGKWTLATWEDEYDTHFADIRLPVTKTPAQIANESSDQYARLKAYNKAGARSRLNKGTWRINNFWAWTDFVENYEVHPDDLHLVPEYAQVNEQPMQQVPLGPEDVMPGSVIRGRNWALDWGKCWLAVLETTPTGVHCNRGDEYRFTSQYRFTSLQYDWQINRSIPMTGKWDANAWEPCYKMI